MKTVNLDIKSVGSGFGCYTIAEIGGNFDNVDKAIELIDLAASAGCDAVKLQTFKADTITSRKAMFHMENTGDLLQWDHFKKYEITDQTHKEIFNYANSKGLFSFSTPSHQSDIDMLEKIGVSAHKIGSDDAVNIPLLKYAAQTKKPILLSTGMCTMSEVQKSVDAILEEGNSELILFHCTTNYPTHPESVNLLAMTEMQKCFGVPVGYSDHTLGIDTCYAAAVLGASILEFHFTFDKNAEGPDHMLSKDYEETAKLIKKVRQLPVILGDGVKRPMPTEMNTRQNNRKSIVLIGHVAAGEKIGPHNVDIKRPGYGIPCDQWWSVMGKTASKDLIADNPLSWTDLFE